MKTSLKNRLCALWNFSPFKPSHSVTWKLGCWVGTEQRRPRSSSEKDIVIFIALPFPFSNQLKIWSSHVLPSVASKRVHMRKKHVRTGSKHDMFCRQTCEVWSKRLLLICCRSSKYSLQEFLDVKNNFWRQVCCFWARNMPESWEKWNMSGAHWSKTYKQLTFGVTVALTAVKLQMFGGKTRHVWHPNRTCFFYLVSTLRCNRR